MEVCNNFIGYLNGTEIKEQACTVPQHNFYRCDMGTEQSKGPKVSYGSNSNEMY